MKILAIETSCDETGVAILECSGDLERAEFKILGNALHSQASEQAAYGGVYPTLAKREHQKNLAPLCIRSLTDAGLYRARDDGEKVIPDTLTELRDPGFQVSVAELLSKMHAPAVDMIAVTRGPGLEPALWTGITFAEALGNAWNIPVLGIDHMEGHIVSALLKQVEGGSEKGEVNSQPSSFKLQAVHLPLLALLISGGHTELILMEEWFQYRAIGKTRDDAVGEAFDKVARLLDLTYPGGPEIARLAEKSRARGKNTVSFTPPMMNDATCDFSFSGLKTAVLYHLKKSDSLSEEDKQSVAEAFENAARDSLVAKTTKALRAEAPQTLVIAGGVAANTVIRNAFLNLIKTDFSDVQLCLPDKRLSGDNAIMIGAAAYLRKVSGIAVFQKLKAEGKLALNLT